MSTRRKVSPRLALVAGLVLLPTFASAQDQRFRVSFAPAVAATGGDAALALGGTIGYRFSERFWFEGDLSWLDAAAGGFRDRRFEIPFPIAFPTDFTELIRRNGRAFGPNAVLPVLGNLPVLPILPGYPDRLSVSVDGSSAVMPWASAAISSPAARRCCSCTLTMSGPASSPCA